MNTSRIEENGKIQEHQGYQKRTEFHFISVFDLSAVFTCELVFLNKLNTEGLNLQNVLQFPKQKNK